MAIDNAEKRRSAAGVGFFIVGPGVTPNASKDAEWRLQAGWGYSGIALGAPLAAIAREMHRALANNLSRPLAP